MRVCKCGLISLRANECEYDLVESMCMQVVQFTNVYMICEGSSIETRITPVHVCACTYLSACWGTIIDLKIHHEVTSNFFRRYSMSDPFACRRPSLHMRSVCVSVNMH